MSVTLIGVSHDTVVSNKQEEQTRHYYVNFQHHHPWTLLLRCSHRQRTPAASQRTLSSLRSLRLLSYHGTSTTSLEKGNSWHRPTRSVLSSTRGSRTLPSSSSRSSCKGNSPSRVLMQALRRRSHAVARTARASHKTMPTLPLPHFSPL